MTCPAFQNDTIPSFFDDPVLFPYSWCELYAPAFNQEHVEAPAPAASPSPAGSNEAHAPEKVSTKNRVLMDVAPDGNSAVLAPNGCLSCDSFRDAYECMACQSMNHGRSSFRLKDAMNVPEPVGVLATEEPTTVKVAENLSSGIDENPKVSAHADESVTENVRVEEPDSKKVDVVYSDAPLSNDTVESVDVVADVEKPSPEVPVSPVEKLQPDADIVVEDFHIPSVVGSSDGAEQQHVPVSTLDSTSDDKSTITKNVSEERVADPLSPSHRSTTEVSEQIREEEEFHGPSFPSSSSPASSQPNETLGFDPPTSFAFLSNRFNYASYLVGAKILDSAPGGKGAHNVLNKDEDKYWRVPCSQPRIWTTIELPDEILVDSFSIANFEHYAGSVRRFAILGASKHPCKAPQCSWIELGRFEAPLVDPDRSVFTYSVSKPAYVRYLRFLFLNHHSHHQAFYCTVSQIQVYGSTQVEEFKRDHASANSMPSSSGGVSGTAALDAIIGGVSGLLGSESKWRDHGNSFTTPSSLVDSSAGASFSGGVRGSDQQNVFKMMLTRIQGLENNQRFIKQVLDRFDEEQDSLAAHMIELARHLAELQVSLEEQGNRRMAALETRLMKQMDALTNSTTRFADRVERIVWLLDVMDTVWSSTGMFYVFGSITIVLVLGCGGSRLVRKRHASTSTSPPRDTASLSPTSPPIAVLKTPVRAVKPETCETTAPPSPSVLDSPKPSRPALGRSTTLPHLFNPSDLASDTNPDAHTST